MRNWILVEDSRPANQEPPAVDYAQSPDTVYERRNVQYMTQQEEGADGETVTRSFWRYEQRAFPRAEYERMQAELHSPATQLIMQQLSALELQIELKEVI